MSSPDRHRVERTHATRQRDVRMDHAEAYAEGRPGGSRARADAHRCRVEGCPVTAWHGKPFCPDHVALSPYAGAVAAAWEQRAEDALRGRARPGSTLSEDALVTITALGGSASVERIARELGVSLEAAQGVARGLARQRLVRLEETQRGSTRLVLRG